MHKRGLVINQFVYLVFLIYLNLLNYYEKLDETIDILLGYFMLVCCVGLIILAFVRLYYEFKYGE